MGAVSRSYVVDNIISLTLNFVPAIKAEYTVSRTTNSEIEYLTKPCIFQIHYGGIAIIFLVTGLTLVSSV